MSYDALLFLQGRSPRFNLSHIAFSSAVSFGEVSCNAALARALAAMMKRSALSTPSNPMGFDGVDKADRFIIAARARAKAALHETSPKLTALEKAMWLKLKRGERPCKNSKAS